MSSTNWLSGWNPQLLPRLDQLDVITPMALVPDEDFAAEAPAPVTTPAGLPIRPKGATLADEVDWDAPVPYALAEPLGPVAAEAVVTRGSSSVAGLAALRYGPMISSGGAVTEPNPAPSDDSTPSLVALDREEAARDSLIANVLAWANGPVGHLALEAALRLAVTEYEAATR